MDYRIKPEGNPLCFFGRTLYDMVRGAMFFNWTASGFALAFQGRQVTMEAVAFSDHYPGEGENLPWLAIFVDDMQAPYSVIQMEEGKHSYLLFESDQPEKHVIRVVKRSENSKGRVGLVSLALEGDLLPYVAQEQRIRLEFIGDSITQVLTQPVVQWR